MNHEKEIDRLGVEYSAGIEDFKEYATRLFSMDPEELTDIFYGEDAELVEPNPEQAIDILKDFSARCIVDTLDSYDMKLEQKARAISKLLKPGNVVYLNHVNYKNAVCKTPVVILGWRDYYDSLDTSYSNRLGASEVIITFYDLVSQMILDDELVKISDISEADFVHDDISYLVKNLMDALRAQSDNYFKKKDDEERRKFDLPEGYRLKKPENAKRSGRYKWEDISTPASMMRWIPEEEDDD